MFTWNRLLWFTETLRTKGVHREVSGCLLSSPLINWVFFWKIVKKFHPNMLPFAWTFSFFHHFLIPLIPHSWMKSCVRPCHRLLLAQKRLTRGENIPIVLHSAKIQSNLIRIQWFFSNNSVFRNEAPLWSCLSFTHSLSHSKNFLSSL